MRSIFIRPRLDEQFGDKLFTWSSDLYPAFYGSGWAVALKEALAKRGYQLMTIDMAETLRELCDADKIIFMGYYNDSYFKDCNGLEDKMAYYEVEFPVNENVEFGEGGCAPGWYLDKFSRILTWKKDMVDNKRVFYMQRPNNWYHGQLSNVAFSDRRLCVMASSNKISNVTGELYSERRRAVEFLQRYDAIDLYGRGWTRSITRFVRRKLGMSVDDSRVFRTSWLARRLAGEADYSKCLKGSWTVDGIYETYARYKFAIVYENLGGLRGAVSNRIFDCLQSGCIPIYLGASDIEEIVSPDCFVDKREYTYDELLSFMIEMDEDTFRKYLANGRRFLMSEGLKHFEEGWAKEFSEVLLK